MNEFPNNILILLSHASFWVPENISENLKDYMLSDDKRLLKNFSDWWTKFLISEKIPKEQIIEVNFSRAIWDPNRARWAFDIFRDKDFWWLDLWKNPLTDEQKEELLKNYYDKHHTLVKEKIKELKSKNEKIFIIDVHDTWNLLMWEDFSKDKLKEALFPELAICDSEWITLNDELKKIVDKAFKKNLNLNQVWNDPYKFSFTSSHYCDKENWIFSLQVEFWRYLLIDEKTQTYNPEVEKLKEWLYNTLKEIWGLLK